MAVHLQVMIKQWDQDTICNMHNLYQHYILHLTASRLWIYVCKADNINDADVVLYDII
jgi:hypothetical protein